MKYRHFLNGLKAYLECEYLLTIKTENEDRFNIWHLTSCCIPEKIKGMQNILESKHLLTK